MADVIIWLVILDFLFKKRREKQKRAAQHYATGRAGERNVCKFLIKTGVAQEQIFRNVYLPAYNGQTTEIDILVVSRKGILIFENKACHGTIYGDGRNRQWLQYIGHEQHTIANPLRQNRFHAKCLKKYLKNPKIPVIPFTTKDPEVVWKVRNISRKDHFIRHEEDFLKIYRKLPNCAAMPRYYNDLLKTFRKLEKQRSAVRDEHARQVNRRLKAIHKR